MSDAVRNMHIQASAIACCPPRSFSPAWLSFVRSSHAEFMSVATPPWHLLTTPADIPRRRVSASVQGNACSAGDSAAYERIGGSMDDVVIISALRTPICKAKRGGLKDTTADDLLATVLKATLQQTGIEPAVRLTA